MTRCTASCLASLLVVLVPPLAGRAAPPGPPAPSLTGATGLERWLSGDTATGDWRGARSRLAHRGLGPYAVWTGEVFRNFHGGIKTGTDWQGLLEFGADVDLEKAVGLSGASLHANTLWIQGDDDPSGDLVGNFDEVSNIAAEAALRFYQLYFKQELRDGAFGYKLGELVLGDDFMTSDGASLFLNASFGSLPVESANTPAPTYPLAALGGWAQWIPRKDVTLQIGLYSGDAGTQDSNESGFDYDLGSTEGVMVIAETAVDATFLGCEATAKVGGYYHTGDFTDFDSGRSESGIYALYLILDQVFLGSRDQSRLAAFFRLGVSPLDDRSVVDWYLDAGMTAKGLRENDRVGLGFSHAHFGDAFDSAQDRAGTPVTDAESVIELTYSAQLTPWLTLQPSLQYVIDPQDEAASDAFVGGLRAAISF